MKLKASLVALALAPLLACGSGPSTDDFDTSYEEGPVPIEQRIELRRDVDPGPGPWDQPDSDPDNTIDTDNESTKEGETFIGGAIVVDKIRRQEGDSVFSVDLRLHNRTGAPIEAAYLIEFRSATHDLIMGQKKDWQSFLIAPFDYGVVTNSALIRGSAGFRLFVRHKGSEYPGYSDPNENGGAAEVPPAEEEGDGGEMPPPEEAPDEEGR